MDLLGRPRARLPGLPPRGAQAHARRLHGGGGEGHAAPRPKRLTAVRGLFEAIHSPFKLQNA